MLRSGSLAVCFVSGFLSLLLANCSPQNELAQGLSAVRATAGNSIDPGLFANGDKVRVTVFNEPQLSGEFTVEPTGTIAYPLIGSVEVVSLTPRGLESRLSQKLRGRYLVDPKVSVEVVSQRPFVVLGEVSRAGEYPYRPGLNVVGAIGLAGGHGPRAATTHVVIQRSNEREKKRYPVSPGVPVYPGDMITVPERYF
jgi:polysaccharide export outer membrane protein